MLTTGTAVVKIRPSQNCGWIKQVIKQDSENIFHFRPVSLHRPLYSTSFATVAAMGLGAATVLSKYIIVMDCCWLELS